ncbi:hypothetical protein ACRWP7_003342 [Escherichia coli]
MLTIEYKSFADMLGISESELAFYIANNLEFKGHALPKPVTVGWNNKRKFSYYDVIDFMKDIEGYKKK